MSIIKFNRLYALLLRYPEQTWDWIELTGNPNITVEIIERHPEWGFNPFCLVSKNVMPQKYIVGCIENKFLYIMSHSSFSWADVEKLVEIPAFVWCDKKLDLPFILNSERLKNAMNVGDISLNRYLRWQDVVDTPEINWNYIYLLQNDSLIIPLDALEQIIHEYCTGVLPWKFISKKPNITLEFVEKLIEMPWDWISLTEHSWFTPVIYEKYKDKIPHNFFSRPLFNKSFSLEYLLENKLVEKIPSYILKNFTLAEMIKYHTFISLDSFQKSKATPLKFAGENDSIPGWMSVFTNSRIDRLTFNFRLQSREDLKTTDIVECEKEINWTHLSSHEFDIRGRAAATIWKEWVAYKIRRITKSNMQKVLAEIALLPRNYVAGFPGGEEYQEAHRSFVERSHQQ